MCGAPCRTDSALSARPPPPPLPPPPPPPPLPALWVDPAPPGCACVVPCVATPVRCVELLRCVAPGWCAVMGWPQHPTLATPSRTRADSAASMLEVQRWLVAPTRPPARPPARPARVAHTRAPVRRHAPPHIKTGPRTCRPPRTAPRQPRTPSRHPHEWLMGPAPAACYMTSTTRRQRTAVGHNCHSHSRLHQMVHGCLTLRWFAKARIFWGYFAKTVMSPRVFDVFPHTPHAHVLLVGPHRAITREMVDAW